MWKSMYMKRILYFILPLLTLCCCAKHEKELPKNELDKLGTIDSVSCYNTEKDEEIIVNDSAVLRIVSNGIKNTVVHKREYYLKVPPYYGTITFYANGEMFKYKILGDLLTQNGDFYYECSTNFQTLMDSLVFKSESI